jgi:hypothetical protein
MKGDSFEIWKIGENLMVLFSKFSDFEKENIFCYLEKCKSKNLKKKNS